MTKTAPIFFIENEKDFWKHVRETFAYQFTTNPLFQKFCKLVGYSDARDFTPEFIPFLPVEAFRDHDVLSGGFVPELSFKSSGTTGIARSRHGIADPNLYADSITFAWDYFFPGNPVILAYTPGYSDNPDSSLVWMLEFLIGRDESGLSRFLTLNEGISPQLLREIQDSGRQLVLFGAAFGLLDLAERFPVSLPVHSILVETGGMKTYRKEITRTEMHRILSEGFNVAESAVQSEYGMCELLSQAYAKDGVHFKTPAWMRFFIVDAENPFRPAGLNEPGRLAVIDLANQHSCSFILTGDRAIQRDKGVEILGRWNAWDLRGCNFLLEKERQ